jgi:hypothetical protein
MVHMRRIPRRVAVLTAALLAVCLVGAGAVIAATESGDATRAPRHAAVRVSINSDVARNLTRGGSLPAETVQLTGITAHLKLGRIHKPAHARSAKTKAGRVAAVRAAAKPAAASEKAAVSKTGSPDLTKFSTSAVEGLKFSGLEDNEIESDTLNVGEDLSADTEGVAGPKDYVESVGFAFGVFDKATGALIGSEELHEFFEKSGLGAPCEKATNTGYLEPHVLYDPHSDRYIIMAASEQNAEEGLTAKVMCIGASKTGDPAAGGWYYYAVPLFTGGAQEISHSAVGMWTNGVYLQEEIYCKENIKGKCPGNNELEEFDGTQVWAFNNSDLESGTPLEVVTTQGNVKEKDNFKGSTKAEKASAAELEKCRVEITFCNEDAESPTPANIEPGLTLPPDSSEASKRNEYFLTPSDLPGEFTPKSDGLLDVWQWHVNWAEPGEDWIGKSKTEQYDYQVVTPTFYTPNDGVEYEVPAAQYAEDEYAIATAGGHYANSLASEFDYIKPKPEYTDFGGKESLWAGYATSLSEKSATVEGTKEAIVTPDRVRWEQISIESGTGAPKISAPKQTQDYAPEPTKLARWLPAIGVDKESDMALGYSGTDPEVFPSLYIAGQEKVEEIAEGKAKIESLPETVVDEGHGYQTGESDEELENESFGPQNSMALDPNGCEFWFAGQTDVGSPTNEEGEDDAWATQVTAFHFQDCAASSLATGLSTKGEGDKKSGTATLTATLTAAGTHSGLFGEPVSFSLGGKNVGTASTNDEGVATLSGVDSSSYAAGLKEGVVGASYAGASAYSYAASEASGNLLVGATQTIKFGALANKTYGEAPFTVSASASSGEPVTFAANGTCTVTGKEVTITGAGICTITASQPGNGSTLLAAPAVSQEFDIAKEPQKLTATGSWTTNETVGKDFTASATSSVTLPCTPENNAGCIYFHTRETEKNCTEVETGETPQATFLAKQTKEYDETHKLPLCTVYAESPGNQNVASVVEPITVEITNEGSQTGKFSESLTSTPPLGEEKNEKVKVKTKFALTELTEGVEDPVTWTSELATTSVVVTGSTSQGSIAAASTATLLGEAITGTFSKITDSKTEEAATCKSPAAGTVTFTFTETGTKVDGIQPGDLVTVEKSKVTAYNVTGAEVKSATSTTFTYCIAKAGEAEEKTAGVVAKGAAAITVSGTTATAHVTAAPTTAFSAKEKVNIAGVKSTSAAEYNNKTVEILSAQTTTSFTFAVKSGTASGLGGTVGLPGTGAAENGGVATINLATEPASPLSVGQEIEIGSVAVTTYDGTFKIKEVLSAKSFTFEDAAAAESVASGGGELTSSVAPCTYSVPGFILKAQNAGKCKIEAKQAGNESYTAGSVTLELTITGGTQTVTWSPNGGNISSSKPTEVSATTNSGLSPGTITSTTTTVCTVGATTEAAKGTATVTVTPVTEGKCILSASGNGGTPNEAELKATTKEFAVSSAGAAQTLTFAEPKPTTLIHSPLTLSATASSGLAVTFMSSTESVCTTGGAHGETVTLLAEGTCTIKAEQAGESGKYAAATSVTRSFRVAKADQVLVFNALPNVEYGAADFSLKGTGAAAISENAYSEELVSEGIPTGLQPTYEASGACTVNAEGTDVHITSTGVCSITATQVGNSLYREAPAVGVEFRVLAAPSSITFENPGTQTYGEPAFNPGATVTSGAAVTYTAEGACTITGEGLVKVGAPGTCTVTAHGGGTADYLPPARVSESFTVVKANQSISFSVAEHTYGEADFTISATATSGEPVSFAQKSGKCTVSGSTVHITGSGSCTITASQAGNADYNAAPELSETFNIHAASQTITFPAIANQSYGGEPFPLEASASSGLTVSYTASGPCEISGETVVTTGVGTCEVTASQQGSANYYAATSVTRSFEVGGGTQTITFKNPGTQTFGEADFEPVASASSGLPVTFTAEGACQITEEGLVHLSKAGSCKLTAHQSGNSKYQEASPVSQSFTVARASQTITFPAVETMTYGEAPFNPGASASSGLGVEYAASGECAVTSGGYVEITGAGSCTVEASQAGDSNYLAAKAVKQTFTIAKASQTISFSVEEHSYGEADFSISATATSGEPVSFAKKSGECELHGSLVHLTGAGSCTIVASQAGNADYKAAPEVLDTFSIHAASQTITFPEIPNQAYGGEPVPLEASASSGLAVSYAASGPCEISGETVVTNGVGTCEVTASQSGNSNYEAASSVTRSFAVGGGDQTITFKNPGTQTYGEADFNPGATASSGLPVSYTATGVCSITESGLVHLTETGSCSVTAHQEGSSVWNPAPEVEQTFTVAPASQSITFASPGTQAYGEAPFKPSATASSGLAVTFEASEDCKIVEGEIVLTGAGSCTVTARQPGDGDYNEAPAVSRKFEVEKGEQTIDFSVAEHTYGEADFTISATATSGGAVTFTVGSGECTVSGDTVHISGAGSCTIDANQAGDSDYKAAPEVKDTFRIKADSQTISFPAISEKTYGEASFAAGATASSKLAVSYSAIGDCEIESGKVAITGAGSCTVKAAQAGNEDYEPASEVERTFTIGKASQTITFNPPASKSYGSAPFQLEASSSSGLATTYTGSGTCSVTSAGVVTIQGTGSCEVTASQVGNNNYMPATPVKKTITITSMSTTTTFVPVKKATKVGKRVKYKVTVKPAVAGYTPVGTVAIYINNQVVSTQTLTKGTASYTYKVVLPARSSGYPVTVKFTSSSSDFAGSESPAGELKVSGK